MYASQILLLSAIALASPVSVIAESKITKLAPDSVNVYLENGKGQASVVLLVQPKTGEPQVAVTDAMGSKDSISMSSITWSWGGNPWNSAKQAVLRGELKVGPYVYVKEGEEYKGKILFIWAESTQPVSIDFIVKRQSTTELTVSPEALDVALGPYQPRTVTIHLKNTGNAAISKLEVSSVGLVDAGTRNSTGPFSLSAEKIKIVPLKPSEEKDLNVDLPLPSLAGTYVGSMNLLANDDARKSVPLTLRTRGPTRLPLLSRVDFLSYLPRLPLVLFILVIALGFLLSTKLEDWFAGGGLQRAQAILSLRQSQSSLEKKIDLLNKWEVAHHAAGSFVQARTKIGVQLIEIETLLSSPDDFSLSQLVEAAQRVGSSLPFYDALWLALIQASNKWNADEAKLLAVARQLDRVTTTDLAAYRDALVGVLTGAAEEVERAALAPQLRRQIGSPAIADVVRNLKNKIKFMAVLYRITVWFVVLMFAYQAFYAGKFSFGTFLDYQTVFLWALGLTQTGSQILLRAHSSYSH